MEYETLSTGDKLQIAQDALRGAETDHFRVTLDPIGGGGQTRLDQLEDRVLRARRAVEELQTELEGEAPLDVDREPDTPDE